MKCAGNQMKISSDQICSGMITITMLSVKWFPSVTQNAVYIISFLNKIGLFMHVEVLLRPLQAYIPDNSQNQSAPCWHALVLVPVCNIPVLVRYETYFCNIAWDIFTWMISSWIYEQQCKLKWPHMTFIGSTIACIFIACSTACLCKQTKTKFGFISQVDHQK